MIKKRFLSMLMLLMVAVTGAWAENYYNVTFDGFYNDYLNATVITTLPKTFTEGPEDLQFIPWNIVAKGDKITNVTVTYDESEMVEAFMIDEGHMSITVSGAFDGNATIHVDMLDNNGEKVSAEITVTCVFAYEAFDVTYNANGGSGAPSAQEKRKDTDLTLSTAVPTRTGYTFAGWNTAADGSGNAYAAGATYSANADVTLYAQWTPTYTATVAVTGVTLAPTTATLTLGETETVTLIPTVLPDDATDKSVTWTSSDEAVATVTDGVVTAVAAGEATITVTTTDGAKTATCTVTVAAPAASTYTVTLKEDTEDANNWTIAPAEATTTGVAAGTEVKATYGGTKKVKSVKAKKAAPANVPVESITLNKTATTISTGQTETLSVSSVTPDDATDQTVTWSSDNDAVATVDADGKVTAVALGTANITATANDGSGVTATCAVTVNKVVTINQSDWGSSSSFTKDGVTVSAGDIDPYDGNLMEGGTFSTTLGNFTKIVVTTYKCFASGTGWSGSGSSMTWAGTPASTVSFSGNFMGMGKTQTTIVCTIVPKN